MNVGQCSIHHADLYEDHHDGVSMRRWLCPEPGCSCILPLGILTAIRDQAWAEEHGIQHPDWSVVNVRSTQ